MEQFEERFVRNLGDKFKGDLSMPEIILRSQPKFGLSMEMNANAHDIAHILKAEAQKLIEDGCTIVTLACNTMDVFNDMLTAECAANGAVYIPIHALVKEKLAEIGATDVIILGADPVASLGRWSTYKDLPENGYTVHETPNIDDIGYAVKGRKTPEELLDIVQGVFNNVSFGDLPEGRKPVIVCALTELSEVFNRHPEVKAQLENNLNGVGIIDTMSLLSDKAAEWAAFYPKGEKLYPSVHSFGINALKKIATHPRALQADTPKQERTDTHLKNAGLA